MNSLIKSFTEDNYINLDNDTKINAIMELLSKDIKKSSFLTSINFCKNDTYSDLLANFALVLKYNSESCDISTTKPICDIVGTGGDKKNTFNISTPASIIASATGLTVCKHGNRSSTSNSGSADVLEQLGANITLDEISVNNVLNSGNFCFIYAPQYHKLIKYVMPVRKNLGIKTIFNFLGPLINPTNPQYIVLGVSELSKCKIIANSLLQFVNITAIIVHGNDIDKINPYGETHTWLVSNGTIKYELLDSNSFGISHKNDDYYNGCKNMMTNAELILSLLNNKAPQYYEDFVLVHSAMLYYISGNATTLKKAMNVVKKTLKTGKALEQLNNYIRVSNQKDKHGILKRIVNRCQVELNFKMRLNPVMKYDIHNNKSLNIYKILKNTQYINIIGEIKKSSPSAGNICPDISIADIVNEYISSNLIGISVLTEPVWFSGSLNDIKQVKNIITHGKNKQFVLRKDFIFSEYQILESKINGADSILLIVSLEKTMEQYNTNLKNLIKYSRSLGMEPVVEITNLNELDIAILANSKVIGINNRNLDTFIIDLTVTENIMKYVSENPDLYQDIEFISLSGIFTNKDIYRLVRCGIHNFLIGTSLMKSNDKEKFISNLLFRPKIMNRVVHRHKMLKICGIRTRNEVISCIYENVDIIGLMFYEKSKRYVGSIENAKELVNIINENKCDNKTPLSIGIFVNESYETIRNIVSQTKIDGVQLYGYNNTDIIQNLKKLDHNLYIIWTVSLVKPEDFNNILIPPNINAICIDKRDGSQLGGTGQSLDFSNFNWSIIPEKLPVFIAGGINIDNINLFKNLDIAGIDISTGVEDINGKDHLKIREISRNLKSGLPSYFGNFGGQFTAEILMPALIELENFYLDISKNDEFNNELHKHYKCAGRPTQLYCAERLTEYVRNLCNDKKFGATIWLKREDLLHTGAHKINNSIGQGLLAKYMNKKKIIAETGAGQHGCSVATICALFNLEGKIYMGETDIERQKLNVFKMKKLGTEVIPVTSGNKTLNSAVNAALRKWASTSTDTHYLIGSAVGPHPFPTIVRDFQSIIGKEAKKQFLDIKNKLPDAVIACIGGGSNSLGIFDSFINEDVKLIGAEAEGCSSLGKGTVGYVHGSKSLVLQSNSGQIEETHSISAGLDYPGVSPILSFLVQNKRVQVHSVNDAEALEGFDILAKTEGILCALESAHAVYLAIQIAQKLPLSKDIIICLSGRGDKDILQLN